MKTYTVTVDDYGTKCWYLNDKLHREHGNRHCEHGPAIEWADGSKEWYLNGKRHREDGPAVEYSDGSKSWYLNGKCHRTDGPAIECANGNKCWYLNGECHRTDGPAIERIDGTKEWYLNDEKYTEADWLNQLQKKLKATCVDKVVEVDGVKYKLVKI